ncbi:restriction endonuclease subunit S [Lactiplantibacillus plantarum]|uniref:restriction endonuclease subunit S n=1 Tax=Lactiplantibacillus plantarum TaxID=1590 RepID=UPI003C26CC34
MKDNQAKYPQLRFNGFTDPWEQRKTKELCDISTGKGNTQDKVEDGKYPFYVRSATIERSNEYLYDQEAVLTVGDGVGTGKVFHYVNGKYNLHQRVYRMFNFNHGVSAKYFYHYFSKNFYRRVMSMTAKTSVDSVRMEMIADMKIKFPSPAEQETIVSVLDGVDDLISFHQRKLAKLKKLKQGYLQKLFPKNGAKVPELRFAGFADAWEQRKLGEVGKTQSGIGFPDAEQGGTEGVPFYKVSDMNKPGNEHEMVNANNYVNYEQLSRKKWKIIETVPAVIFAKVGAAIMLNRKRLVTSPFLIDNNTMAYVFYGSWNIDFGKTLFETINLPRYAQVGALPSYNGSDIESIEVTLPNKGEQVKLGAFFKSLDDTITLHQRKLEKLQELKKGYLQKMFC